MKKVTIKDIANEAGVSYATVSRALSGSNEISTETKKRILGISRKLGYTANTVARSLVANETKIIGLIVGSVNNPFMSEIAYHLELKARAKGYNLMFCNSFNDIKQEEEAYKLMIGRQVDGIVIVPTSSKSYDRLKPYVRQVPTVFFSDNLRDMHESYVSVDNLRGTYIGTKYLYSIGHRKIVYFARRLGSITHELRLEGYLKACDECGIKADYVDSSFSSSSVENGYQLAKDFFADKSRKATAIFASTDTIALGVLKAAQEAHISIPKDLSLMGFDNISFVGLPCIELTTINQPLETMAAATMSILIDKITDPDAGYYHTIAEPSLIVRNTCAQI
ncbi:MAG: LacI family transcriptional regulator [Lachnospiraceae bacterium]|jgi:LacI family transcriptional regulator|nr:LacI family transcriptional regulator [Lachnospiraceae bacterium]